MKIFFFIFFFACSLILNAQEDIRITGRIRDYYGKKLALISFHGHHKAAFDTVITSQDGRFAFTAKRNAYIGLCRIQIDKDKKIDLILDNEDIDFETTAEDPSENMTIYKSEENAEFYRYLEVKKTEDDKLNLLNQLVLYYPKDNPFYKSVIKEFMNIQKEQQDYINRVISKNPGKFISGLLTYELIPVIDADLTADQQSDFLKAHYLDYANFADTNLLNSDLIPTKLLSFLSLYLDRKLSPAAREEGLKKAIDIIVARTHINDQIYTYVFDYLTNGFEQMGMNSLISYLVTNYEPGKACVGEYGNDNLKRRIENFKTLAIGKKAPDFELPDQDGKMVKLSSLNKGYTLIIFWFSTCPHCRKALPVIRGFYNSQKTKQYEVVTVSLDTNRTDWITFLENGKFPWINLCDFKGWAGTASTLYSIYQTPTMLLLDRNGTIVGKPGDERELKNLLKQKGLL